MSVASTNTRDTTNTFNCMAIAGDRGTDLQGFAILGRSNGEVLTDDKAKSVWKQMIDNCAFKNPFSTVFKRGNDYVQDQWSEEYFIGCKANIGIAKKGIFDAYDSMKQGNVKEGAKHLLKSVSALMLLGLNIQLGNFIKGALGAIISTGKFVFHGCVIPLRMLAAVVLLPFVLSYLCRTNKQEEKALGDIDKNERRAPTKYERMALNNLKEIINGFGFMGKDLLSLITSVGHTIPSWLPFALTPVCPPAGIALFILKKFTKFTGSFDLLAYGGTSVLLLWKARVGNAGDKAAWNKLKHELNPLKSVEGAILGVYAVHVIAEGVSAVAEYFLPGSAKLCEKVAWAVTGVAALALGKSVHRHRKAAGMTPGQENPVHTSSGELQTQPRPQVPSGLAGLQRTSQGNLYRLAGLTSLSSSQQSSEPITGVEDTAAGAQLMAMRDRAGSHQSSGSRLLDEFLET